MSYRIKTATKSQAPDDLQLRSGIERLLEALREHRRAVVIVLVVLFLAVAVLIGVGWYDRIRADEAQELARQATKLYLDRPVDQAAKADDNLKSAIEQYRKVVDDYPHSPVTPLALYHLGNALMQANDAGGAIDAYRRFIATYGNNKSLLGLVYQRLGYAHLLQGNRDQAEKSFAAALEVPGALNKDQVLFELGKLEESLSRPEGALARYQELMKSYPNSPFASEAAVRVKALEVRRGPETSSPAAPSSTPPAGMSPGASRP